MGRSLQTGSRRVNLSPEWGRIWYDCAMLTRHRVIRLVIVILTLLVGYGLVVVTRPERPSWELLAQPVTETTPLYWQTPPGSRYNPFSPVPPSTGYPVILTATPSPPNATPLPFPTSATTLTTTLTPPAAQAVDVTFVYAHLDSDGTWTFRVTVRHSDTGPEKYADGWDVQLPDGTVIKPDPQSPFTYALAHPHVGEQPVTREESGLIIPPDVTLVLVRAHDTVNGYAGQVVLVKLDQMQGSNFEVER